MEELSLKEPADDNSDSFATHYPTQEAQFVTMRPEQPRVLTCSDERRLTHASMQRIKDETGIDPDKGGVRDFGGLTGDAYDMAVNIAAMQADSAAAAEALQVYAGALGTLITQTKAAFTRATNHMDVTLDHSDDLNDTDTGLNMASSTGVGCLFDTAVGTVAQLAATNLEVQAEAREEFKRTINPDTQSFEKAVQGAKATYAQVFGGDESTSITRETITHTASKTRDGEPLVAICAGSHAPLENALEVVNYIPNSFAKRDGKTFVTDAVDAMIRKIEIGQELGYTLDPEVILGGSCLKRAVVRYALAGGKAGSMAHAKRGDAHEALAYVREQFEDTLDQAA